jgi:hypothetical protein
MCRRLNLFAHAVAAIDGSKFKAENARDKNFTRAKLQKRMEQVEASIERYLSALETADRQEGEVAEAKSARLKDKIASLRDQMRKFKALEVAVDAAPDKQISLTDPDARSMATSGKGTGVVGCPGGGGYPASPDCRARGHQYRHGSGATCQHGFASQGGSRR